jgi:hypothetical protein
MKVYRISKWAFGGICILILLLPVSRHWRLLITGERTTGTVTQYVRQVMEDRQGDKYLKEASEIEFVADGVSHKTLGPENYEYKTGRSLKLIYDPEDPSHNCIVTFSGFYLSNYTVLPIILITFWYAFYLSFNKRRKRMKNPGGTARDRKRRIRIS